MGKRNGNSKDDDVKNEDRATTSVGTQKNGEVGPGAKFSDFK